MSPRDSFWFLAGVLVAVAIMVSVRAWRSARSAPGAAAAAIPVFAVPIAAALALLGVALGVYFLLGSPDPIGSPDSRGAALAASETPPVQDSRIARQRSATAGTLDEVTNKLAARLAADGGSDNDWKLLAQSYEYMGQKAEAQAARAHIASVTPTSPATGGQIADIADALDKPHAKVSSNMAVSPRAN